MRKFREEFTVDSKWLNETTASIQAVQALSISIPKFQRNKSVKKFAAQNARTPEAVLGRAGASRRVAPRRVLHSAQMEEVKEAKL